MNRVSAFVSGRPWLAANRLSLTIVALTALGWLILWLIWRVYADGAALGGGSSPLEDGVFRRIPYRWKLHRLAPELQWRAFIELSQAFVMAVGLAWLIAMRGGLIGGLIGKKAFARITRPRRFQYFCAGLITFFLFLHVRSGLHMDYAGYVANWSDILSGEDPWRRTRSWPNNFGPFFNAFALLAAINPFWPKVLFIFVWFGGWLFLLGRFLDRAELSVRAALLLSALFVLGPFFWVLIGSYPHFDIIPAAIALIAVHLTMSSRPLAAGAVLGLGVLAKFYPVVVLPFLMLRGRSLDWRPAIGCLVVVGIGFAAAYLLWGESTFEPIVGAIQRGSKQLSIFRFLEGRVFEMLVGTPWNLHAWAAPLMFVAGLSLFLYCYRTKMDIEIGVALAPVVTYLLYPRGHFTYFAICFLLIGYWYAMDRRRVFRSVALRWAVALYLGWVSVFALGYLIFSRMDSGPTLWMRDLAGFPAFIFGLALVLIALREARRMGPATSLSEEPR